MIIDFHVHAFNDKIAERAISKLEATVEFKAFTDGTLADTIKRFDEWGVDKGVLLPIATKPSQQTVINDWSIAQESEKIIPFGSVHPDAEDALDELVRIKNIGLKGIKLHPDYQGFIIDDEKLFPIYKKCAELDLPIVFHGGVDAISPDFVHAMPENTARAFKSVPEMTMIIAHLGGMNLWDDVEKYLVGLAGEIYFDTAFIADYCSDEQAERIIKNHGANRILFASDCPWHKSTQEIDMINRLNLSDDEKEMIFYKNAERILNLK